MGQSRFGLGRARAIDSIINHLIDEATFELAHG